MLVIFWYSRIIVAHLNMATFKFYLYNNAIKLDYSYARDIRIKKSTKINVNNKKNWLPKSQKIRECREEPGAKHLNYQLQDIKGQFENEVANYQRDENILDNARLIEIADYVIGNTERKHIKNTLSFMQLLHEFGFNPKYHSPTSGMKLTDSTRETYRSTYKCLENYCDLFSTKLTYEKIDLVFYNQFREWCTEEDYKPGTFGKFIKIIKAVMNAGLELEYHSNMKFKLRGFKVEMSSDEDIYLNEDEIQKLFTLDLKFDFLDDRVRDLFIIGATTGFRISDLNTLSEFDIITENGKKYITKTSQKTKTQVSLPVTKNILIKTLEKRNYQFPKAVIENKVNERIKLLCEKAGIINEVRLVDTRLKGKREIVYRKCELVTTHTARRSFCTNAYLSGMEAQKIMVFSGHKKLDTFLRYIKADHLQKAKLFETEPFFQK